MLHPGICPTRREMPAVSSRISGTPAGTAAAASTASGETASVPCTTTVRAPSAAVNPTTQATTPASTTTRATATPTCLRDTPDHPSAARATGNDAPRYPQPLWPVAWTSHASRSVSLAGSATPRWNGLQQTREPRTEGDGTSAAHGPAVDQDGGGGRLAAGGADWESPAVQYPAKKGRATAAGKMSDDVHPRTGRSILGQAGLIGCIE
jgi:hypothetical protein